MEKQEEFDIFFSIIAPSLKLRVQNHIFNEILKRNKAIYPVLILLKVRQIEN